VAAQDPAVWEAVCPLLTSQINAAGVHVWPFDPSFPIDVRSFIASGRESIRMNRHDYLELMYICSGLAELKVQDRSFRLNAGDLVVMGGGIYHGMLVKHEVRVIALYFEPELIMARDTNGEHLEYLTPFLIQGSDFPHVVSGATEIPLQIHRLMEQVQSELPVTSTQAKLYVKTYLKMILVLLMKHYADYRGNRESLERQQRAFARLRPVFQYIEQNYCEVIRVRDAARLCGISNSYLMGFFKQTTGQSFLSYVTHFRIAKAQALLATTDLSISEIGQEVGFCDQSHFGLAFRKLLGTTPLAFRHQFQRRAETVTQPVSPRMPFRWRVPENNLPGNDGPGPLWRNASV
jgi:AraC-like DNA-binding protein